MNPYLLGVLGLLGIFIVGVVCYGFLFKSFLQGHEEKLSLGRFAVAGAGMYVISLAFIYLFKNTSVMNTSGVMKGIELALLIGVPFMAIPIFADAPYFKSNKAGIEWTLIVNWLVSFVVLGIIVGALA